MGKIYMARILLITPPKSFKKTSKKKGKPEGLPKAQHAARENEHALKKTTIMLLHERCQKNKYIQNSCLWFLWMDGMGFSHHKTAALHLGSALKLVVNRIFRAYRLVERPIQLINESSTK